MHPRHGGDGHGQPPSDHKRRSLRSRCPAWCDIIPIAMSRWSLAVRAVLSLCLVLNGFGSGVAAHTHPAQASDFAQATSMTGPSTASRPCHGAHARQAAERPPMPTPAATDKAERLPSCCHLASCGGSCLHHAPAAITSGSSVVVVTRPVEPAEPRALHASVELPHLTRPPIV